MTQRNREKNENSSPNEEIKSQNNMVKLNILSPMDFINLGIQKDAEFKKYQGVHESKSRHMNLNELFKRHFTVS